MKSLSQLADSSLYKGATAVAGIGKAFYPLAKPVVFIRKHSNRTRNKLLALLNFIKSQ